MIRAATRTKPSMLLTNQRGVTLLETMVYLVMAGMLLATAVTSFLGQNKSYNRQDVIAEIQQNIRGATQLVASDIRFAGLGFEEQNLSKKPFATAESDKLAVNYWDEVNEETIRVHYRLDNNEIQQAVENVLVDTDQVDALTVPPGERWQKVAENIDEIYFEYLYDKSDINDIDTVDWEWTDSAQRIFDNSKDKRQLVSLEDAFDEIHAVKIVILGSARQSPFNQTDQTIYQPPLEGPDRDLPWVSAPGTGYKRMMSFIVECRNN